MANDKDKKPAPPAPSGPFGGFFGSLDPIETIVVLLILLSIISMIAMRLSNFDLGGLSFFGVSVSGTAFSIGRWFEEWGSLLKFVSFTISGGLLGGAIYFSQLAGQVVVEEKKKLYPNGEPQVSNSLEQESPMTNRWQQILNKASSPNESDWRLAIIEADIILSELLEKLGLPGETIGEKLKAVEKSDFTTLDYAWEAHKARNAIAHEGSGFLLNQRETRRIISLYEAVFREFELI